MPTVKPRVHNERLQFHYHRKEKLSVLMRPLPVTSEGEKAFKKGAMCENINNNSANIKNKSKPYIDSVGIRRSCML